MAKTVSEIDVLRYFEEGPIDKAELLFNIVSEKMRQRLGRNRSESARAKDKDAAPKRREAPASASVLPVAPKSEPPA